MKILLWASLAISMSALAVPCPTVTSLNERPGDLDGPMAKLLVPANNGRPPTSLIVKQGKRFVRYDLEPGPAPEGYDPEYNSLNINMKLTVYESTASGCKSSRSTRIPTVGLNGGGYDFFLAVSGGIDPTVHLVESTNNRFDGTSSVKKQLVRASNDSKPALELIGYDHKIIATGENTVARPEELPGHVCGIDVLNNKRSYYERQNEKPKATNLKGLKSNSFKKDKVWYFGIDEKVKPYCVARKGFVPLSFDGMRCDVGAKLSPQMLAIVTGDGRGSEPLPDISEVTYPYVSLNPEQLSAIQEGRPLTIEYDLPLGTVDVDPAKTSPSFDGPGFTFFVNLRNPTQGLDDSSTSETDKITCKKEGKGGLCTFDDFFLNHEPMALNEKEFKTLLSGVPLKKTMKITDDRTNVYVFKRDPSGTVSATITRVSTDVRRISIDCVKE